MRALIYGGLALCRCPWRPCEAAASSENDLDLGPVLRPSKCIWRFRGTTATQRQVWAYRRRRECTELPTPAPTRRSARERKEVFYGDVPAGEKVGVFVCGPGALMRAAERCVVARRAKGEVGLHVDLYTSF